MRDGRVPRGDRTLSARGRHLACVDQKGAPPSSFPSRVYDAFTRVRRIVHSLDTHETLMTRPLVPLRVRVAHTITKSFRLRIGFETFVRLVSRPWLISLIILSVLDAFAPKVVEGASTKIALRGPSRVVIAYPPRFVFQTRPRRYAGVFHACHFIVCFILGPVCLVHIHSTARGAACRILIT